jgi:hypothetical protein
MISKLAKAFTQHQQPARRRFANQVQLKTALSATAMASRLAAVMEDLGEHAKRAPVNLDILCKMAAV